MVLIHFGLQQENINLVSFEPCREISLKDRALPEDICYMQMMLSRAFIVTGLEESHIKGKSLFQPLIDQQAMKERVSKA